MSLPVFAARRRLDSTAEIAGKKLHPVADPPKRAAVVVDFCLRVW
jgi:hypothetical protein